MWLSRVEDTAILAGMRRPDWLDSQGQAMPFERGSLKRRVGAKK